MAFFKKTEAEHTITDLRKSRWDSICTVSNIILSVIYVLGGWVFSFGGVVILMFGGTGWILSSICIALSALLFIFTPAFCILGIVFSVRFRKKEQYDTAVLVQFLPFTTVGIAASLFFVSLL